MSPRPNVNLAADVPSAEDVIVLVGRELRAARQRRGEDLYDVADLLRIKPSYLFALEEGDYAPIPGLPYAYGFLRSYADHLQLDGQKLIPRIKAGRPSMSAQSQPAYPVPPTSERRPSMVMALAALVVIGLGYGGWSYLIGQRDPVIEVVSAPPAFPPSQAVLPSVPPVDVAAAKPDHLPVSPAATVATALPALDQPRTLPTDAPGPAAAPDAGGATPVAPGGPPGVAAVASAGANDLASAPDASAPVDVAADAPSQPADEGRPNPGVGAASASEARVVLVATEASWIQVRSADRQFSRSRLMEAGEHFPLPDRADLALWTGNAGGLAVMVDGVQVPPLGARGAVLKNVPLDPAALKARTAQ